MQGLSPRQSFILKATLGYVAVSATWIAVSDRVLAIFVDVNSMAGMATLKGLLYVLITSLVLFHVLHNVPEDRPRLTGNLLESFAQVHSETRFPRWLIYVCAIMMTLLMLWIRVRIGHSFGEHQLLILFVLPISVSALLGGLGPGITATLISVVGVVYFTMDPIENFLGKSNINTFQWMALLALGLLMSWLSESLHRSLRSVAASRTLLDAVISGTSDAVYVKDKDGRYLMLNDAAARFVGKPRTEVLGRDDRFVFPAQTAEQVMQVDRAIMASGETRALEEHCDTFGGQKFTFRSIKGALKGSDGKTTGLFGIAHDLTERMAAEEALRASELRFATIFRASPVGNTMTLYEDGRIIDVNDAWLRMLGHDFDDVIGRTTAELGIWPDSERRDLRYSKLATGLTRHDAEETIRRKDGSTLCVQCTSDLVHLAGRNFLLCSWIDITLQMQARSTLESRRLELEALVAQRTADLESARLQAEQLARVKSDFLANMSHEIRTPMNGVLGLAQIGYRESVGHKSQRTFLRILESGQLLVGIINDILDFSKIDAGKMQIESIPVNVSEVIDRCAEMQRARAESRRLQFIVHKSDDLPISCLSDPVRLQQILTNLLSNAIKFTSSGSITLSCERDADQLLFRVQDSGIGMTEDQTARLFTAFEQADGSTTRHFGGTGLGLAITKRITDLMQGTVAVSSAPGTGSCFEVRLPLRESSVHATLPSVREQQALDHARSISGLRVLVVEDNEINQLVLSQMLAAEGVDVQIVGSGLQAVELIAQNGSTDFDLVLMDVQMPEMDGYEATRRILQLAPDTPIVGQTAHAMQEELAKCIACGMLAHITKPIDAKLLLRTVQQYARRTISA
jgi:PAS domain S-box-containing protein